MGVTRKEVRWDFPGGPMIKTSPSSAGCAGLILSQEAKSHMTHDKKTKTLKKKKKTSNILTNWTPG